MGDFGGTLRSARERKGISLRHIANATKISMGALESLERNDFDRLPGGIFSRSFVRAYAQEVGLDPDQTVADFLKEAGETFEPPPSIAEEDTPLLEHPDPALDFRQSWRPSRMFGLGTWTLMLLLIGVPVAGYLAYRGMKGAAPDAAPPASASDVPPQTPQQAPAAAPAPGTAPSAAGPIPDLDPGQTMRMVLAPTSECWVSLTVDGDVKLARLLQPGERETHEIREGAVLEVGDAAAMSFTINGRASKPIGARGAVETLRITRSNFRDFLQ